MTYIDKRLCWALACSAMLALAGCDGNVEGKTGNHKDGEDDKEEVLPTPVEVATVNIGDVTAVYSGTAVLEADGEATVMAKVGGELLELLAQEGDVVKAGQVVARVDDQRLRLEVKRSRANLDKARQEYKRNVELHEKGLLPAGTFEGLKYDLDALQVAYELAQLELSYTTVKAPIGGTISERLVKAGNTISANAGIFRITDLDPLLAYLHVPERDFQKLAKDQPVRLSVDALPGEQFVGRVQLISPVIDSNTGTFKVTVEVADQSGRLMPGMFSRVSIVYDRREAVPLMPRVALLDDSDQPSVFIIKDGTAQRRNVRTGYTSGANLEVVDGVIAGERVVVIGQAGLRQDAKVHVIEPGASVAKIKPESDKDKD